jgi:SAM-dependent methyltransferase
VNSTQFLHTLPMKIQLVPNPVPQTQVASPAPRVPYGCCPLCQGNELITIKDVDGSLDPVMGPEVESAWSWQGCETCGHLFTEGMLDPEAHSKILCRGEQALSAGSDYVQSRNEAAQIVHRISGIRGSIQGVWLDVGFGNGDLLTTAQEFGYDPLGIDTRSSCVEHASSLGLEAACASIEQLDGEDLYDVISFSDVLGYCPFPVSTLATAARLLRPGGLVYLSTPNLDSRAWSEQEAKGLNAEWEQVERNHLFSREHICWALRKAGLEPCDFMASPTSAVGMELCATLASDDE